MRKYITIIIFLPKLTKKIYNFKKICHVIAIYCYKKEIKKHSFCYKMKKKTEKASSISKAAQLQSYRIVAAWRPNNRLLPRGNPMLLPLKIRLFLKMTAREQLQARQAAQINVQPKNPALSVVHSILNFFINRLFFCRKLLFVIYMCSPQSFKMLNFVQKIGYVSECQFVKLRVSDLHHARGRSQTTWKRFCPLLTT